MILRAVISHPDDPTTVHITFDRIPMEDLNKMKKWIRRKWKNMNPHMDVQFKYFYTEDDFDDL